MRASALLALCLMSAAAPTASLLRKDLSAVSPLNQLVRGKPHAIWFVTDPFAGQLCPELSKQIKLVESFGLTGTLIQAEAGSRPCGEAGRIFSQDILRKVFGEDGLPGGRVMVVDGGGVVRFDHPLGADPDALRAAAGRAIAWEQGRQGFSVHCGHCHGDDGTETSYPGVKSMAGLSTRLTDAKILEGAEQFGAVPVSTWSVRDMETLLVFIRGL